MAVDVSVQVELIAAGTSLAMIVVTRLLDYYLPPSHQRPRNENPDPAKLLGPSTGPPEPLTSPPQPPSKEPDKHG